ncbi:MAG: hypothetical protein OXC91_07295 [Rhodobacteraceae bacterium]|nr:hypothetical protein [Paracoccaceae bacterium]
MKKRTLQTMAAIGSVALAIVAFASLVGGGVWYGMSYAATIQEQVHILDKNLEQRLNDFEENTVDRIEALELSNEEILKLLKKLISQNSNETVE